VRRWVGFVAADSLDATTFGTSEADLDAAVALAEDARRRVPVRGERVGRVCRPSRFDHGTRRLRDRVT